MNIDWSKASDDFPLWLEGLGEHAEHSGWYRRAGDVFEHETHGQFRAFREGQFFTVHHKPEQLAWNGEGLPPIGVTCKLSGPTAYLSPLNPDWAGREVKIYAHFVSDRGIEMAAYVGEHHDIGGVGVGKLFVPIRTPEQIAAEERANEVRRILDAMPHDVISGHTGAIVEWMLADGYRKQVTP